MSMSLYNLERLVGCIIQFEPFHSSVSFQDILFVVFFQFRIFLFVSRALPYKIGKIMIMIMM